MESLREPEECSGRERLGARLQRCADGRERLTRVLARSQAGERKRVRQRFATVREGGRDDLPYAAEVRRELPAPERDERRVDVRLRPEDRPRDRVEAGALGRELDED